jgi:hypothetical protein
MYLTHTHIVIFFKQKSAQNNINLTTKKPKQRTVIKQHLSFSDINMPS